MSNSWLREKELGIFAQNPLTVWAIPGFLVLVWLGYCLIRYKVLFSIMICKCGGVLKIPPAFETSVCAMSAKFRIVAAQQTQLVVLCYCLFSFIIWRFTLFYFLRYLCRVCLVRSTIDINTRPISRHSWLVAWRDGSLRFEYHILLLDSNVNFGMRYSTMRSTVNSSPKHFPHVVHGPHVSIIKS